MVSLDEISGADTGGAAGLLPPLGHLRGGGQNAEVKFLISNYEDALRFVQRRHFPCQSSFIGIITLGSKVNEGFRWKIRDFYSRIFLFIFLFFRLCSFL